MANNIPQHSETYAILNDLHYWEKDCLFSGSDTPYKCKFCGATANRYGVSWPPVRTGKYKAEKWKSCPGPAVRR